MNDESQRDTQGWVLPHDRRRFLQGATGAAAGAGVAGSLAAASSARADGPRSVAKIDVHAYYLPAVYRQALIDNRQPASRSCRPGAQKRISR
jgi:hypothetical protein